jgi:hypothetical protein
MFRKLSMKSALMAILLGTLGVSGVAAAQPRFEPVAFHRVYSPYDLNRDGRLDRFELRLMRRDLARRSHPYRSYRVNPWRG